MASKEVVFEIEDTVSPRQLLSENGHHSSSSPPNKPELLLQPMPKLDQWRTGTIADVLAFVQSTFGNPSLTLDTLLTFIAEQNRQISVEYTSENARSGGTVIEITDSLVGMGVSFDLPARKFFPSGKEISYRFFENTGNAIFPSWKKDKVTTTDQS